MIMVPPGVSLRALKAVPDDGLSDFSHFPLGSTAMSHIVSHIVYQTGLPIRAVTSFVVVQIVVTSQDRKDVGY